MAEDTIIGIDVGTTTVKALLATTDGRQLDRFSGSYPTARAGNGVVEQDPEAWLYRVLGALAYFERNFDLGGLKGIGICSQVNTHVFVDGSGRALAPAIVWQDGRCASVAAELDAQVDNARRIEWWGAPLPIDASHGLSRMAWMRRHHPDLWEMTRWVMAPKDYCILRLTGEAVADPIASVGLVGHELGYLSPLLDLVPGAASRLAPLHGFTHVAGGIVGGLPCAGTPVMVGAMDAWGGMFGVGVHRPDAAMYLSGTSEIMGIVSPSRVPTPGVIAFPTYDGITLHAAPTQSGGASIAWLGGLFGKNPEELSALAATLEPNERVPLFLPHLQGERAPIWDAHARGLFVGLDAGMGPAHVARAVMEGVGYSARWLLESLERSADCRVEPIHCGGGGFQSEVWNQIRADILGRTLRRVATSDVAALGAAAIAAVGSGVFPTLGEAIATIIDFDREYHPNPNSAARHEFGFDLYKETYEATRELSRKLVEFHGG
ncbi:FGGY-family carbohydrate kinase [Mesorhizobium sp. BAC0120]|uniref:xylulokinase n=1 Tax=Mesorhizobium sp. BAC0120 TaxID=3090670 RepID=UPI00298C07BF|nr:FGGY-family carbohydrate kinase [Mesorhizobium sp. BAC0120]MDW6021715.1 FGGY-family carbohydrate kinase [Mesorhizobium sp. BAC0120]